MKAFVLLGLLALVSVQALPAKREQHNSKLSRQEPLSVAPVTKVETTKPVVQKVSTIEDIQIGSLAPVGEIIETPSTTTLRPIIPDPVTTVNPLGDPKAPPPPKVTVPQVNVTGLTFPESFPPSPERPPRPPPSTTAPVTTTKKPEEEDSSSEEEEQGPPGPAGGSEEEAGPGGPPGGPPGPPGGEEETANEEDTEDDNENEDTEDVVGAEDVEDEEAEDEEAEDEEEAVVVEDEERRRTNLKPRETQPSFVALEAEPDMNTLADPGLDAFIPGYISPEGEVLVPIDTLEHAMPYSIIPDKQTKKGRLGIARQEFREESSEEVDDNQDDESASAEDEDATSEEEEEDEALPVRINSFNIIYDKQKKKQQEKQNEDVHTETETETEEVDGAEPVEEVSPPEPTNPPRPRPPPISDGNALIIGAKEKPETRPTKLTEEDLNRRPPPLAYVPATRPTNEDDENEFRHNFRSLFFPSGVHPGYRYFYPEPSYAYEPYHEDVSQEYYGYY